MYEKEVPIRFIDKSGFCTTCHEKQYGCAACVTMKFKTNQEDCFTCKVQNGRYKNHYYPATTYSPPLTNTTEYYENFNYLTWFDSYADYNVDIYSGPTENVRLYWSNLNDDRKCASIDCQNTKTALQCDATANMCPDYWLAYDVFFYLNTVEHAFVRLFTIWDAAYGNGAP